MDNFNQKIMKDYENIINQFQDKLLQDIFGNVESLTISEFIVKFNNIITNEYNVYKPQLIIPTNINNDIRLYYKDLTRSFLTMDFDCADPENYNIQEKCDSEDSIAIVLLQNKTFFYYTWKVLLRQQHTNTNTEESWEDFVKRLEPELSPPNFPVQKQTGGKIKTEKKILFNNKPRYIYRDKRGLQYIKINNHFILFK